MRSLLPSLLSRSPFSFHLLPALTQRVIGTLPNSSAHTLAIWQPAPGANPTSDSIGHSRPNLANWQTANPAEVPGPL